MGAKIPNLPRAPTRDNELVSSTYLVKLSACAPGLQDYLLLSEFDKAGHTSKVIEQAFLGTSCIAFYFMIRTQQTTVQFAQQIRKISHEFFGARAQA